MLQPSEHLEMPLCERALFLSLWLHPWRGEIEEQSKASYFLKDAAWSILSGTIVIIPIIVDRHRLGWLRSDLWQGVFSTPSSWREPQTYPGLLTPKLNHVTDSHPETITLGKVVSYLIYFRVPKCCRRKEIELKFRTGRLNLFYPEF